MGACHCKPKIINRTFKPEVINGILVEESCVSSFESKHNKDEILEKYETKDGTFSEHKKLYNKRNAHRWRNTDDFVFKCQSYAGGKTTAYTEKISHCVYDINIQAYKYRDEHIEVYIKIPTDVFNDLEPDIKSMSLSGLSTLHFSEYQDAKDALGSIQLRIPEVEDVRDLVLRLFAEHTAN